MRQWKKLTSQRTCQHDPGENGLVGKDSQHRLHLKHRSMVSSWHRIRPRAVWSPTQYEWGNVIFFNENLIEQINSSHQTPYHWECGAINLQSGTTWPNCGRLCTFALWKLRDRMFTLPPKLWLIDFLNHSHPLLLFCLLDYSHCLGIDSLVVCNVAAHPDKRCIHVKLVYLCVDHGMNEPQLIWSIAVRLSWCSITDTWTMEWAIHSSSGLWIL